MKKNLIISKEDVTNALHNWGSVSSAAVMLGIKFLDLKNLMLQYGLSIDKTSVPCKNNNKQYDFVDMEWLQANWVCSGKSLNQLSREYSIPASLLEARRAKYGVSKKYLHPLNLEKLTDLSDPHTYYVAGLIATDGTITKDKRSAVIALVGESERDLLNSIINYYECKQELALYGKAWSLRLGSTDYVNFLGKHFNILQARKTYTVGVPVSLPNECCAKAYIRGCFDGDGYINKSRLQFDLLTASEKFVNGLANIIESYTGQHLNVTMSRRKESYYPHIGATDKKARLILEWMYSLDDCFRLERKYSNFVRAKDIV